MPHPLLYEINTRCWLRELSAGRTTRVTLATVPDSEFAEWRTLGFTHIWLMGVWTTGPRARAEALRSEGLRQVYREVLPDWTEADVAGSPYAIAGYRVPDELGGESGLASFRKKLNLQGIRLLLDFVPNHVGLDHAWVRDRPELFVQSPAQVPDTFEQKSGGAICWLAHGKDPYFSGWTDTVQLDYRRADTREAMLDLLQSVAGRCDGVRCDMAMLLLNDVFNRTWEKLPVSPGQGGKRQGNAIPNDDGHALGEFWPDAIAKVRAVRPDFLFLSEVYWGLEERLQTLGFDYTYDKELYDKLVGKDASSVQRHLLNLSGEFIAASAHFLENHDERRAASALSPMELRAAALVVLGLPGMRFLHEGQLSGVRLKIPVQLARRPVEAAQSDISTKFRQLLTALRSSAVGQGRFEVLRPRAAWPENPTAQNFVIVQWQNQPLKFDLVVVNLAAHRSQCYAPLNIEGPSGYNWALVDLVGEERYVRAGKDLERQGLYLDLPEHGAQVFHFEIA